jgi:uncharacterized protein with NAD-binding domain and iron-sulfur cluster
VRAQDKSKEYRTVIAAGLTRNVVAAKETVASARTIGYIGEAFVWNVLGFGNDGYPDRVLVLPTNEAWIDPWVAHLKRVGVQFVDGYAATKLHLDGGHIVGAQLSDPKRNELNVTAQWFVAAMPVERARVLFDAPVRAAAPELVRLDRLTYDYMNGIQFFLNRPPAQQVKGHAAFLESPWALTSIDQGLFWSRNLQAQYGSGNLGDILSVDISDFFTPGIVYGRRAVDCTPQQIATETWAQLKAGLNTSNATVLSDDMIISWFLDPAIRYPAGGGPAISTEPLLINTAGSLDDRPHSTTSIPNLFLAADYVRTNVDLATMEGANQAGRQAANAILAAAGLNAPPAMLGKLWQPAELDTARRIDEQRYMAGQPNVLDTVPAAVPL